MLKRVHAGALDVAYEEAGPPSGAPVLLLHGFPYDIHAFDEVTANLAAAGCRVIVPYVRGYGPTRFLSPNTPRSGQQAVLAHDVTELMDALAIENAVLAGFDWGSRSACIVAALWPKRVRGLVAGAGYIIQDIAASLKPAEPEAERRLAALPSITVPAIALHGADDGVTPAAAPEKQARFFRGPYERHVLSGVGHNLPQEAPQKFSDAVLSLVKK